MKCTMLYQDPETRGRGCPSVYLAETGELVLQGPEFDVEDETVPNTAASGQVAVRVKADVLARGLERYLAETPTGTTEGHTSETGAGSIDATPSGHLVVRGPRLDDESLAGLVALLDHETAVRVAPHVVIEAVERSQDNG